MTDGIGRIFGRGLTRRALTLMAVLLALAPALCIAAPASVYIEDLTWTELRDRWEWSHVARAALAVASLVALVVATVIRPA